jgi:hypothetical protein
MERVNENQPNNLNTNQPSLGQDVVAIPEATHPLQKHPRNFLPKFKPERKDSKKDHINKFVLANR